jgi:hypothetical protein
MAQCLVYSYHNRMSLSPPETRIKVTDKTQCSPAVIQQNEDGRTKCTIAIGGIKGHALEEIDGNLLQLYQTFRWKPLPNCTGRYTCRDHKLVSPLPPLELLAQVGIHTVDSKTNDNNNTSSTDIVVHSFDLPDRADLVLVVPLDSANCTGLISFEKRTSTSSGIGSPKQVDDELIISYVHTLNSSSGFRRKLSAIGIHHIPDPT